MEYLKEMSSVQRNENIVFKYEELKPMMETLKAKYDFLEKLENNNGNISIGVGSMINKQTIDAKNKEFIIPILKKQIKAWEKKIKLVKKELKELL